LACSAPALAPSSSSTSSSRWPTETSSTSRSSLSPTRAR
jgi:hypothetical protein